MPKDNEPSRRQHLQWEIDEELHVAECRLSQPDATLEQKVEALTEALPYIRDGLRIAFSNMYNS